MVESDGLLNRCRVKPTAGSNPVLTATGTNSIVNGCLGADVSELGTLRTGLHLLSVEEPKVFVPWFVVGAAG